MHASVTQAMVKAVADAGYSDIREFKETASFRCRGCFAAEFVVEKDGPKILEVRTRGTVQVLEATVRVR
jgi:hypothetical protein